MSVAVLINTVSAKLLRTGVCQGVEVIAITFACCEPIIVFI